MTNQSQSIVLLTDSPEWCEPLAARLRARCGAERVRIVALADLALWPAALWQPRPALLVNRLSAHTMRGHAGAAAKARDALVRRANLPN